MRSIEELERLLEEENQKDANDRDFDLIESLVAEIMEQSPDGKLSPEEREREMGKIKQAIKNEEKPKKPKSFKALLVAAIVTVLLLVANFTAMACGVDTVAILKAFGDRITEMVVGEKEEFMGVEIIKNNESIKYDNIEELLKEEKLNILYPTKLPSNVVIKNIRIVDATNADNTLNSDFVRILFVTNTGNIQIRINTNPNTNKSFLTQAPIIEEIGSFKCYSIIGAIGEYQSQFIHNDYVYTINAPTREDVVLIIEGLVESSEVVANP